MQYQNTQVLHTQSRDSMCMAPWLNNPTQDSKRPPSMLTCSTVAQIPSTLWMCISAGAQLSGSLVHTPGRGDAHAPVCATIRILYPPTAQKLHSHTSQCPPDHQLALGCGCAPRDECNSATLAAIDGTILVHGMRRGCMKRCTALCSS
jgi:hypothetical protein